MRLPRRDQAERQASHPVPGTPRPPASSWWRQALEGRGGELVTGRVLGVDPGPEAHGWCVLAFGHHVASGHAEATPAALLERLLAEHRPEIIAIEVPRVLFRLAAATEVIATARAAGEVRGYALAVGLPVLDLDPNAWRKAVAGKANAPGPVVKDAIVRLVPGWPNRSNDHGRDAAGVALAAWWASGGQRAAA